MRCLKKGWVSMSSYQKRELKILLKNPHIEIPNSNVSLPFYKVATKIDEKTIFSNKYGDLIIVNEDCNEKFGVITDEGLVLFEDSRIIKKFKDFENENKDVDEIGINNTRYIVGKLDKTHFKNVDSFTKGFTEQLEKLRKKKKEREEKKKKETINQDKIEFGDWTIEGNEITVGINYPAKFKIEPSLKNLVDLNKHYVELNKIESVCGFLSFLKSIKKRVTIKTNKKNYEIVLNNGHYYFKNNKITIKEAEFLIKYDSKLDDDKDIIKKLKFWARVGIKRFEEIATEKYLGKVIEFPVFDFENGQIKEVEITLKDIGLKIQPEFEKKLFKVTCFGVTNFIEPREVDYIVGFTWISVSTLLKLTKIPFKECVEKLNDVVLLKNI